jgi:hypothetical protein
MVSIKYLFVLTMTAGGEYTYHKNYAEILLQTSKVSGLELRLDNFKNAK